MSTQLAAAFGEMETRLKAIRLSNGFNTELGASVLPAGTWLSEEDAPCMALYEAKPDDEGVMRMAATQASNSCGLEFGVDYMVQAFVKRAEPQTALDASEAAAQDIMRALMGANHGALATAKTHHLTGRGRGLTPKGGNVIPVLVYGTFKITEKVFE